MTKDKVHKKQQETIGKKKEKLGDLPSGEISPLNRNERRRQEDTSGKRIIISPICGK